MSAMNPEDLLFHYTDATGLLGMLGTSAQPASLWLSQIQYCNDDRESWHAYELAQSVINDELAKSGGEYARLLQRFQDRARAWSSRPGFSRQFAFSVSEHEDLLSQWRGYTPHGGYSIGYRFGDLQALAAANALALIKCVYSYEEKRHMLSAAIRHCYELMISDYVDPRLDSDPALRGMEGDDRRYWVALLKLYDYVHHFAGYFKHESFREEAEWRLVGVVGSDDPRSQWRTRGNLILPYCRIDISSSAPVPTPVRKVMIGPGVDSDRAMHAITMATHLRGISLQMGVSTSTLKF